MIDRICFDFDCACDDFWDWIEARQAEQVPGKSSGPHLRDGQVWVPRYQYLEQIFGRYEGAQGAVALDPIVAAMSNDDMIALVDEWDPSTMPAAEWATFGTDDEPIGH